MTLTTFSERTRQRLDHITHWKRISASAAALGAVSLVAVGAVDGFGMTSHSGNAAPVLAACPPGWGAGSPIKGGVATTLQAFAAGERDLTEELKTSMGLQSVASLGAIPVAGVESSVFGPAAEDFYVIEQGKFELNSNKLSTIGSVACRTTRGSIETRTATLAADDLDALGIAINTAEGSADEFPIAAPPVAAMA